MARQGLALHPAGLPGHIPLQSRLLRVRNLILEGGRLGEHPVFGHP